MRSGLAMLLLAVAAIGQGCAGYRLGPTNGVAARSQSVQVNPFINETIEPRLGEAVTHALRKALQQDGTFSLDTSNSGDVIVTGRIVRWDRRALSYQRRDVATPRDYRLTITAWVTARDRRTGRTLLDRKVSGHSTVRVGADLVSAERQGLPLVADDLARNTTALL
ncbi:MAG TPA: LPS assembly lipoprotein LptE, partial [Methylomirabilota bacterium]|nr:LPS assembly lipoprotein LptE [Methylomirabilota bacterium]